MTTHLTLKWSVSRGRETYGWNILTLRDDSTGKRYSCKGGGYDMTGTVFGDWLQDVYQSRLLSISHDAYAVSEMRDGTYVRENNDSGLYGMTFQRDYGRVHIDGACGLESVKRIANAIGLRVQSVVSARGNLTAMMVEEN